MEHGRDTPPSDGAEELDELLIFGSAETHRVFLKRMAGTSAALTIAPTLMNSSFAAGPASTNAGAANATRVPVRLKINGQEKTLSLDPRTTLLDALREHLNLTGSKKG